MQHPCNQLCSHQGGPGLSGSKLDKKLLEDGGIKETKVQVPMIKNRTTESSTGWSSNESLRAGRVKEKDIRVECFPCCVDLGDKV